MPSRLQIRGAAAVLCALLLVSPAALAQGRDRARNRPGGSDRGVIAVRGQVVFVGGYYYDPFFGPYPWWPRGEYPHHYFPRYDVRAELRIQVTPKQAAVYVDGFYAGLVDDFDGIFQSLPLPPGGHEVVLFLEGYRTINRSLYVGPGAHFSLREAMDPLPGGERSERPRLAPPVPPPPGGSYNQPRSPEGDSLRGQKPEPLEAVDGPAGALELRAQPLTARVEVDGHRWVSSDDGFFVLDLKPGRHKVHVSHSGYRAYTTEIEVRAATTTPLNVTLVPDRRDR